MVYNGTPFYPPKWMVKIMGNQTLWTNGWFWGTPLFLETPIYLTYIAIVYWSVNLPSLRLGSGLIEAANSQLHRSTPKLHGWHSTKSYTRSGTAILPESSPVATKTRRQHIQNFRRFCWGQFPQEAFGYGFIINCLYVQVLVRIPNLYVQIFRYDTDCGHPEIS